ncbi:phage integrase site specific recombinase [Pseudomonas putida]|nr:phage integrase site specific recombinase [Pseudomonas putida]
MNTMSTSSHQPRNKGKLIGQKAPLRLKDVWVIRVRLQIAEETRDLAIHSKWSIPNLSIDSPWMLSDLTRAQQLCAYNCQSARKHQESHS